MLRTLGEQEGSYRRIIDDLLWFRLVHNTGAAFGMLRDASVLFSVAAVAVALGVVFYSRRIASASLLVRVVLGLELGGALGNLLDRIRYGHVIDFIDVRLWPYVFNVSDACITIGVCLLLLHLARPGSDSSPAATQREPTANERRA
ncbi:MAG: signal peptidase II [Chloroflexota bacterium]|nr:signal peptidase II [Chloroflexota bacterium]